jgi:hypothetical protein
LYFRTTPQFFAAAGIVARGPVLMANSLCVKGPCYNRRRGRGVGFDAVGSPQMRGWEGPEGV